MIPSEQLSAWLADKESQRRSQRSMNGFLDEWGASPLVRELRAGLDALEDPTAEQVVALARGFLDRLEDTQAMIAGLIERSRADPFFAPPMHPLNTEIHSALMLFRHPYLTISLGVSGVDMLAAKKAHRKGPASVGFAGVWYLFRCIKSGNAVVSLWEAPPVAAGFTATAAGQCVCVGRRRIGEGDELLLDGSRQTFVIDHADEDILYFQAVVGIDTAPLAVEYDSDARTFVGATSTDESSSRVQMMASLLREMDRADAVPVLREMLASPHFYTRWHLMRELLALDAEAVRPDLERMAAEDPHPEVRAAARQTLDLFFEAPSDDAQEVQACRA